MFLFALITGDEEMPQGNVLTVIPQQCQGRILGSFYRIIKAILLSHPEIMSSFKLEISNLVALSFNYIKNLL